MHLRTIRKEAGFYRPLFFLAVLLVIAFSIGVCAFIADAEPDSETTAFQALCSKLALKADESGTISISGKGGWLFLASELRHIGAGRFWGAEAVKASRARDPGHADPLPAILDFHSQLKDRGIDLLMVPVPAKAVVYPDHISDSEKIYAADISSRLDVYEHAFYDVLATNGIQVLDLTALFIAGHDHEKGPVYCMQDSHWSGNGCVIAAAAIAGHIRNMKWYEIIPKTAMDSEWMKITISGDLWKASKNEESPREELFVRRVGMPAEKELKPVPPDEFSPVLLLGDSHNLVFHSGEDMHSRWAGLADQLAFELGFSVDLVGVRGSGATPARINLFRRAQKDSEYWARKKIVIWCFSVREFTQSDGWRKVPIAP